VLAVDKGGGLWAMWRGHGMGRLLWGMMVIEEEEGC
jgi:hypothetical protein